MQKALIIVILLAISFSLFGCATLDAIGTGGPNDPLNSNDGTSGEKNYNPDGTNPKGDDSSDPSGNSNGSTGSDPNGTSTDPSSGLEDYCKQMPVTPEVLQFRALLEEQLAYEHLCKANLLNIATIAQTTCLLDISEKAMTRARTQLEQDIADPPACTRYVLELAEIAEKMPDGDPTAYQYFIEAEKSLERVLSTPGLCTADYLEIATLASAMGFDTTFDTATAAAIKKNEEELDALTNGELHAEDVKCNTPSEVEACSRISFDSHRKSKKASENISINFSGYLKDKTFYSYMSAGISSTYTIDGEVVWTYDSIEEEPCLTITKTGGGTKRSGETSFGYFSVVEDGAYQGNLSTLDGILTVVAKKKTVIGPDGKDQCEGVEGDVYTEESTLSFGFEGATTITNREHGAILTGQQPLHSEREVDEDDIETLDSLSNWMIETPPC